ncbi:zinc-binding dehydrogenase [Streptomyces sp. URMC 123]|uniref:zinc-binding dehydrogenase n=1 Tax=Streptomyces sp. URMC 123 TaxID=3423403 RepID=UPI003F1AD985
MHAIRQYAFGPAENLLFEEVPDPTPGPGQVRIAVAAAGVHLVDTTIRAGVAGGPFPLPELPFTPGREVAGRVDATGDGVPESWLGRRVVAHLGQTSGGYAELALAPVESLHPLPDGLPEDRAVAMIGTGRTAVGILEIAALTADDVVLVMAAAGGLGTLFVQAAKDAGATVVGAAGGPAKVDAVLDNGADFAVDYTAPDWTERVRAALGDRAVTIAFDGVGGDLGRGALGLVGRGGRHLVYGWLPGGAPTATTEEELAQRGVTSETVVGPRLLDRPGGLRGLEDLAMAAVASGKLVPALTRFPLADAATAHTALETRATQGKVVLVP